MKIFADMCETKLSRLNLFNGLEFDLIIHILCENPLGRSSAYFEHRTSNIERRILMTLRFIDFKIREPQTAKIHLVMSPGMKDSGSNGSLPNSAELNFQEEIHSRPS